MRLINRSPGAPLRLFLTLLPFALVIVAYMVASDLRLSVNPADKLLPAPSTIAETAVRLTTEGDRRTGRSWYARHRSTGIRCSGN